MAHDYPVHLSLFDRHVLLVGAGAVARRRLPRLLAARARVRVVAPDADPRIQTWADAGELQWTRRGVEARDLDGAFLVLVASDDTDLNARVAEQARARGAWVNRADAPDDSDFLVPARVLGESCTLSVTTEGHAPTAARRLASELSDWLKRGPERFAQEVARTRRLLLARLSRSEARRRLRALAEGPLWDACQRDDEEAIREAVETAQRGAVA